MSRRSVVTYVVDTEKDKPFLGRNQIGSIVYVKSTQVSEVFTGDDWEPLSGGGGTVVKGADTVANIIVKPGVEGEMWIATDTGNDGSTPPKPVAIGDGLVYNATSGVWENVGPIAGPVGPVGPPGQDGADGQDGTDGTNGSDGSDGAKGDDGDQGPVGNNGTDGSDGVDGQGVPTGGTADQVLAKIDGTDYNTHWVAQTGGGGTGDVSSSESSVNAGFLVEWDDSTGKLIKSGDRGLVHLLDDIAANETLAHTKQDDLGFGTSEQILTTNLSGNALEWVDKPTGGVTPSLDEVTTEGNESSKDIIAGDPSKNTTLIADETGAAFVGVSMTANSKVADMLFDEPNNRIAFNHMLRGVYFAPTDDADYVMKKYVDDSISTPSGLEKIEGSPGDFGWRLIGKNSAGYLPIGKDAIDFSNAVGTSHGYGAGGQYSFAQGSSVIAFGTASFAAGYHNIVHKNYGAVFGANNIVDGIASFASGDELIVNNDYQAVFGQWNDHTDTKSVFEVGIGTYDGDRRNAIKVLNDGNASFPELTSAMVDVAGGDSAVTKRWVRDKIPNNQLDFSDLNTTLPSENTVYRTMFTITNNIDIAIPGSRYKVRGVFGNTSSSNERELYIRVMVDGTQQGPSHTFVLWKGDGSESQFFELSGLIKTAIPASSVITVEMAGEDKDGTDSYITFRGDISLEGI